MAFRSRFAIGFNRVLSGRDEIGSRLRSPLDHDSERESASAAIESDREGVWRKPKQHYGMAEAAANISECEKGKLHVDEESAATEFVLITGNRYRVVGTNIANPAMPLIRYECNDHVTIDPGLLTPAADQDAS